MMQTPSKLIPVAGGVQLASFERGQGKPIVMINGLGATTPDWGSTPERLAQRARVITFDNRGVGQSPAPDEPFTLEQLADDVAAVFDAYGLKSANLIGYSMGGMIAQLLAVRRPELIERLILMSTHAGVQSAIPSTPEVRAAMFPEKKLPREQFVRGQYLLYVAPGFSDGETFEQMMRVRLANLPPLYAWQRQLQAILGSERGELVRNIYAPTLIIHGREDSLIRFGNGEMLRDWIPGARLIALEGCGHMLNWERPDAVVAAVTEFFAI